MAANDPSREAPAPHLLRAVASLVDEGYVVFVTMLAAQSIAYVLSDVATDPWYPRGLEPGSAMRVTLGLGLRAVVLLTTFALGRGVSREGVCLGHRLVGLERRGDGASWRETSLVLDFAFLLPALVLVASCIALCWGSDAPRVDVLRLLARACRVTRNGYLIVVAAAVVFVLFVPGRRTLGERIFGLRTVATGIREPRVHRAVVTRCVAAWVVMSVFQELEWASFTLGWDWREFLPTPVEAMIREALPAVHGWLGWVGYGAALLGLARFGVLTAPRDAKRSLSRELVGFVLPVVNLVTFHRRMLAVRPGARRSHDFWLPYAIGMLALTSTLAPLAYFVFVLSVWVGRLPLYLAWQSVHGDAVMHVFSLASISFLALGPMLARFEPALSGAEVVRAFD